MMGNHQRRPVCLAGFIHPPKQLAHAEHVGGLFVHVAKAQHHWIDANDIGASVGNDGVELENVVQVV